MTNQEIIQDAEQYVRQLFSARVDEAFTYHSISHTQSVVQSAATMAEFYQLGEEDRMVLALAAWFHDTGYSQGAAKDHEAKSQRIATTWLQAKLVDAAVTEKVAHAIGATRWPQKPANLTEQILCDADLNHLGTEDFAGQHKLLRRELEAMTGEDISKKDWRNKNIRFLQEHQYFTDYARNILEPKKQENLSLLLDKQNGKKHKIHKEITEEFIPLPSSPVAKKKPAVPEPENVPMEEKTKKDKEKESRTERGIATMFRIMSDNHVNLSQMADSKANIMISVNTIVLSIIVSVLFSKLQYYPQFIVPTIILCTVCLCAIIFAILATRPNVNKGTFNHEDVQQKKINLLFFGNFFKMELPDYEWAMKEMMNDREYLYGSMIKDIYYLGKVLAKKYKFLRISYNVFMFGLVAAIIAFIIAFAVSAD